MNLVLHEYLYQVSFFIHFLDLFHFRFPPKESLGGGPQECHSMGHMWSTGRTLTTNPGALDPWNHRQVYVQ